MATLLTCPLCRSNLEWLAQQSGSVGEEQITCPSCNADLAPYRELKSRAQGYITLAEDLLSRGDISSAQEVADNLPQIISEGEVHIAGLNARLAIARGDLTLASELAEQCEDADKAKLLEAIEIQRANQSASHEQYNYALTAARNGQLALASKWLQSAATLDPANAVIWQLKLKVDLASKNIQATYNDLQQLDKLVARPGEYDGLEQLLPPQA